MPGVYLTHPEVMIDAAIPVPDWQLSPQGLDRVTHFARAGWLARVTRIVSSPERKAQETAGVLADVLGLTVETGANMGENDRSSTGYLPADVFEAAADTFFAQPDVSYRGWETAMASQARIVAAVRGVLLASRPEDWVLFVGHGAVGTLLRQAMANEPISRRGDQPAGGGCLFSFELPFGPVLSGWHRMEDCSVAPPGLAPAWGNHDAGGLERI